MTAAAVLLLFQTPALTAGPATPTISVREEGGVYAVAARFEVDQMPSIVFDVLTDYAQIPRFMPEIRTSVVRERAGSRAIVEQEAVSSMLMFSKQVHLLLEIDEHPEAVLFRDTSGKSFVRYEGAWRTSHRDGGTLITYALTAQPSFEVPGFILKRLLRRDSARTIEHLTQEIAARGHRSEWAVVNQ